MAKRPETAETRATGSHPAGSHPQFSAQVPAAPSGLTRFREEFRRWLLGAGLDSEGAADVVVACGEACNNAIEHAYGFAGTKKVVVSARAGRHFVRVTVRDTGRWKEPTQGEQERGRGLGIIKGLVDELSVRAGAGGTTVRFTKTF